MKKLNLCCCVFLRVFCVSFFTSIKSVLVQSHRKNRRALKQIAGAVVRVHQSWRTTIFEAGNFGMFLKLCAGQPKSCNHFAKTRLAVIFEMQSSSVLLWIVTKCLKFQCFCLFFNGTFDTWSFFDITSSFWATPREILMPLCKNYSPLPRIFGQVVKFLTPFKLILRTFSRRLCGVLSSCLA